MINPLISVIVPVYNTEKYIDRCLDSIVNQTYKNLEIILVDDCSPDNCPQICDAWSLKDKRIKVIHKQNDGPFKARLTGIKNSNGDFIAFVDSDDIIVSDAFEYMISLREKNNDVDFIVSNIKTVKNENFSINYCNEKIIFLDVNDSLKNFFKYNLWSTCGRIYKRELFDNSEIFKYNENYKYGEDYLINYYLLKRCDKIIVSNLEKYIYFRHSSSIMAESISVDKVQSQLAIYKIILNDLKDYNILGYYYQMINTIDMLFGFINESIKNDSNDLLNYVFDELRNIYKFVFYKEVKDRVTLKRKCSIFLCIHFRGLYTILYKKYSKLR